MSYIKQYYKTYGTLNRTGFRWCRWPPPAQITNF